MNNTAPKHGRQTISDFYFYGELVRIIGPEASNEWWQNCAIEKMRACSSTSESTSSPPGSPTCQNFHEPSTASPFVMGRSILKSKNGEGLVRATSSRDSESRSPCSHNPCSNEQQDDPPCRMAVDIVDIELSGTATSNFGLLFTDAAHIVLHENRGEKISSVQRRSSAIF
jgi:hypothetical protein